MAGSAEAIGFEGGWRGEAVVADRNARPLCELALADAAVVGEKEREEAVRNPEQGIKKGSSDQAT